ncbi:hypothetical protein GF389_06340 [Candidatus Dojkabacteria bacterium]|nr:hypothetical protein [Candidatus Dojkabacteria bacterium]
MDYEIQTYKQIKNPFDQIMEYFPKADEAFSEMAEAILSAANVEAWEVGENTIHTYAECLFGTISNIESAMNIAKTNDWRVTRTREDFDQVVGIFPSFARIGIDFSSGRGAEILVRSLIPDSDFPKISPKSRNQNLIN